MPRFNAKYLLAIFFISLNVQIVPAWRHFWKGRRENGNLGEPAGSIYEKIALPPDEWFAQHLDHFAPTNRNIWQQRFFTNNDFYKSGGPVFLLIGGEGAATAWSMKLGAWTYYAKQHNALLFQLEHRFYGKSHPTEDLSTVNLMYLSSEQALGDLASFIVAIKTKHQLSNDTKWIAFGGSYSGSLAAWLRLKYPHLVHGAVSSSGPLLAKTDFREYLDVVKASLATYSDGCVDSVARAIGQVEELLRDLIGQRNLNEQFVLCDPMEKSIENELDVSNLFEYIASLFSGAVQFNDGYKRIEQVCDIMVNTTIGKPVNRLAAVIRLFLSLRREKCLDYKYDTVVAELKNVSWDSDGGTGGARQWTYQTCTEFGFYQTSDNSSLVFGDRLDVDFFIRQCTDIYGPEFDSAAQSDAILRTNTYYGELHAETTNVIYVHGSIDPWHALGLTETRHPTMPTIYIEGTSHCANMYEPQDTDVPQLKAARMQIKAFIASLLL